MSFITINPKNNIFTLFQYKWKAYRSTLTTLVLLQLIAILFSLGGSSVSETGNGFISIQLKNINANIVIILTLLWAFVTGILITTKSYREKDYHFVTTRINSNVANILFLASISVLAGLTTIMSRYLIISLHTLFVGLEEVISLSAIADLQGYVYGVMGTIIYIFFFSIIGYLIGCLVQVHYSFAFLIPTVIIGTIVMLNTMNIDLLYKVNHFYFFESSFPIFLLKTLTTITVAILCAFWISNQKEVR
ncbi:MAG TPA: hypothetical protein VIG73_06185 [Cerasibacillus sp.]|uniref:hypothetical protein n=1 Tax=Cerasibacillus sp. TaxID=2498711 RepID=UPI002F3E4022